MNSGIMITGANGFVGRALVAVCAQQGLCTRAVVRDPGRIPREPTGGDECVQWQAIGDIHDKTDWQAALKDVGCVVHLAARVHVMRDLSENPMAEFQRVNVKATERLARQAAKAGVKRLVFMSSVKVNGEATSEQPFTEDDLPAPEDAYGKSKLAAEERLWQVARETGLEIAVIRPALVYGPGAKGNLARLRSWIKRGVPLPLGSIQNARSLVDRESLVELVLLCAAAPEAAGQVFLAADQEYVSSPEIARAIARDLGVRARLLPMPVWLLRLLLAGVGKADMAARLIGDLRVNADKAREMLGWKSRKKIGD